MSQSSTMHEVVRDDVGPGDHSAVHVTEEEAEDDSDDGDGGGCGAAKDFVGFGWRFAALEVDCTDVEDDYDEEVGEDGEEAEEIDSAVAELGDGVDERSGERSEGEEAEEASGDEEGLFGHPFHYHQIRATGHVIVGLRATLNPRALRRFQSGVQE
jgi:hypothetical protein